MSLNNQEPEEKKSFFDISQYSEKTRKVIFGVVVVILVAVVSVAIFIVSPNNDNGNKDNNDAQASQAPVDADPIKTQTANPQKSEAVKDPSEIVDPSANSLPTSAEDEANRAQEKIIKESEARAKAQQDKEVSDKTDNIPNAAQLQETAKNGMLQWCTVNPDETGTQKQARLKPYFHADNSDYKSPGSLFYMAKCSVEAVTEPYIDPTTKAITLSVGVAWGAQLQKEGSATTGYTQYLVTIDNDGIINFND